MNRNNKYLDRLVDENALRRFLLDALGPASEYRVEYTGEGHSNETLYVKWGSRELVLRRPPPGQTAETAHDVLREFCVVEALAESRIPVPNTIAVCSDHSVIGSDFFVMERIDGTTLRESEPEQFANHTARRKIGEQLIDTLAGIHTTDVAAIGLQDFGNPEGYLDRQVDRWSKQLHWATTHTDRQLENLEVVAEWLAANTPTVHHPCLVHGDYKLDNVMYRHEKHPELVAVLDWEMSTLGDPRSDLGWLLAFWHDDRERDRVVPELLPSYLSNRGYPSRKVLVERYERQTGISFDLPRFFVTLALYKLAALGEMFYARSLNGDSNDSLYPAMEHRVPDLSARAKELVDGDRPF